MMKSDLIILSFNSLMNVKIFKIYYVELLNFIKEIINFRAYNKN